MATHSSILAWEIPQTEEPGRLQSMGSQRVKHDLATKYQQQWSPQDQEDALEKEMATHSSIFPWRISLTTVGYGPWRHKESEMTE